MSDNQSFSCEAIEPPPFPQPSLHRTLLGENRQWAHQVEESDPGFFERSAEEAQRPSVLWVGCSDSRVPASVTTTARPGDIFVHRNIANQFHLHDDNALSVLDYSVNSLKVGQVVVVGHTVCGGVAAAYKAAYPAKRVISEFSLRAAGPTAGPVNRWLEPLVNLAASMNLSPLPQDEAIQILTEASVKQQVENIIETLKASNVSDTRPAARREVWVHGWVYELGKGRLKDLRISQSVTIWD